MALEWDQTHDHLFTGVLPPKSCYSQWKHRCFLLLILLLIKSTSSLWICLQSSNVMSSNLTNLVCFSKSILLALKSLSACFRSSLVLYPRTIKKASTICWSASLSLAVPLICSSFEDFTLFSILLRLIFQSSKSFPIHISSARVSLSESQSSFWLCLSSSVDSILIEIL